MVFRESRTPMVPFVRAGDLDAIGVSLPVDLHQFGYCPSLCALGLIAAGLQQWRGVGGCPFLALALRL
jgi:hypothetical protein